MAKPAKQGEVGAETGVTVGTDPTSETEPVDGSVTTGSQAILAYVPVLHQGYVQLFEQYPRAEIWLLGRGFTQRWRPLQKDIRAVAPEKVQAALEGIWPRRPVRLVEDETALGELMAEAAAAGWERLIMPNEEIMTELAAQLKMQLKERLSTAHLDLPKIELKSIFLRWDRARSSAEQQLEDDLAVSTAPIDRKFMRSARRQAELSSDWWRQVGAVLVKDGQIIAQDHNHHLPSEHQPYIEGDPRADFSRGQEIDKTTAQHAEAGVISQAARAGESTAGTDLYVTTFPCPVCAKLVAESGIKRLFFAEGYTLLDGRRVLESQGVELVRVEVLGS
ncbi:MAG: deoxycytidylate deaminase [Candidatus Pacebacteria bacterium CG10_big_fil_rev_8_21_14_0_10_56_10]|nr:MAG: deoxycytidylate deaminase [Candidatus Pacebacteria bacterium CG10_big_fil_rev_8_21_14_0_10_56_10]